jgi:23S rRNA pseudouridine1911/1915/1917 synthase
MSPSGPAARALLRTERPEVPVPHHVRAGGDGLPLLQYLLRHFPSIPSDLVERAVSEGRFELDGGSVLAADSPVRHGQTLLAWVPDPELNDPHGRPPPDRLCLLHRDEHLLAVDKPAGLLCYPLGARRASAQSIAERQMEADFENPELRPLHRIDRETSGVLMFARNVDADRRIKKAFQKRRVRKSYLALVRGRMPGGMQRVSAPIGPDEGGPIRVRMRVRSDGQAAETMFRTIASFGDDDWGEAGHGYSWVECRPVTGRTHQLRVHLAHLGHPIVGDKIYLDDGAAFLRRWEGTLDGDDLERLGLWRHALHAWSLSMPHPVDGRPLQLLAPVPQDMSEFSRRHGGEDPAPPQEEESAA